MTGKHSGPRVLIMPDGGTALTDQPVREAGRALAEAASRAYVDMKRAEFDQAVEEHCLMFGFDTTTGKFTA